MLALAETVSSNSWLGERQNAYRAARGKRLNARNSRYRHRLREQ